MDLYYVSAYIHVHYSLQEIFIALPWLEMFKILKHFTALLFHIIIT